MTDADLWV